MAKENKEAAGEITENAASKESYDNSKYKEVIPTMDPRNLDFWKKCQREQKVSWVKCITG